MGYDLYITREQQDVPAAGRLPISLREFCSAIADRPGWSVFAGVGSFTVPWNNGQVTVSVPTSADIPELLAVADLLGAVVAGEYGE